MKVAICLSGEPRNFHYIWPDLSQKINLSQADIFIHTWFSSNDECNLPEHKERAVFDYQNYLEKIPSTEYVNILSPKNFLVENYYSSDPYLRFKSYTLPSTITRMYSMFYGIQASCSLPKKEEYDFVIRMRPDIFLEEKLNWVEISEYLTLNPKNVMIPDLWINIGGNKDSWTEDSDQWPDFFCIYKADNKIFNDIYDEIQNICGLHTNPQVRDYGNLPSLPEDYLNAYLRSKGASAKKMTLKMMLARHHKQITNNEQII
jgi:hypothetical protein